MLDLIYSQQEADPFITITIYVNVTRRPTWSNPTYPQIGIQFLPIDLWCSKISSLPCSKSTFSGSDGRCKCFPLAIVVLVVVVVADSAPDPNASAPFPINMLFVAVLLPNWDDGPCPAVALLDNPSADISHEEIIRDARMYSCPAPTL